MKKIIAGSLYNTETAREIGSWDNGLYRSDFSYCAETLYRTKSGKYFIHGEGGPNSKYGVWKGNTGSWGEEIRPYTPAEAREWAEEHLTAEEYIKEFGEPEEASDDKVPLNLTILASTKAKLEKMKSETGKSISAIIDELVNNL